MSVVSVVCCQEEVFTKGRSLVQRSPTDCVCVGVYVRVRVIDCHQVKQ